MPKPREIRGHPASAGFARGPLWLAPEARAGAYRAKGDKEAEGNALRAAIAAAAAETAELMAACEGDAVEILEFQLAMLEDDALSASAIDAIDAGARADEAWTIALDAEIEAYKAADDAYFRARSADLEDIRDRVLGALTGAVAEAIPPGSIYVADDIAPSAFLTHDWTGGGMALRKGSSTGHVAMLARQRGVPAIVTIGDATLTQGEDVLLDAEAGVLTADAGGDVVTAFETARARHETRLVTAQAYAPRPAATRDGTPVRVLVNVADPADVDTIPIGHVDGVGLMRTEFLYNHGLPDEETQFAAYARVLSWANGKPVTIRTVDAGGDKPVAGFTEHESNPFLGIRGIRLCLAKPDIFAVQIRALLRAAPLGNLKVMLPMVSVPQELDEALEHFRREASSLARAGTAHAMPELGIMVEVPSVAIAPERFAGAAFFSIGSNDLTQYALAASRDSGRLAHLARADDPSVVRLIANVAQYGARAGREVSLCGDAASAPELIATLLNAGLRTLSVAASRIGIIKAEIAATEIRQAV